MADRSLPDRQRRSSARLPRHHLFFVSEASPLLLLSSPGFGHSLESTEQNADSRDFFDLILPFQIGYEYGKTITTSREI